MALNLFAKTYLAHHQSTSLPDPPEFLICETDDSRATAFLEAAKHKGGHDLCRRITRVGNGKEQVPSSPPVTWLTAEWPRAPRGF
jgi:3-hydroxyisobutyrate dehydrogenase